MKQGVMYFIGGLALLVLGIWVILEFPGTGVGGAILGLAYTFGVGSGMMIERDNR